MISALPLLVALAPALPLPQNLRTESARTGPPLGQQLGAGKSVVATQDQLLVGAPRTPLAGNSDAGVVITYNPGPSTWLPGQVLNSPSNTGQGEFGSALALGGNRVVVGEPRGGGPAPASGSASVFVYDSMLGTWQFEQQLFASDGVTGDNFGVAVAIDADGTRIVIGAPNAPGTPTENGAVYVFQLLGTSWNLDAKLPPPPNSLNDEFGIAVDVTISAGTPTVLIGCPGYDTSFANAGSLFIYEQTAPMNWAFVQELQATNPEFNARFGRTVTAENEFGLVGSPRADVGGVDAGLVVAIERGLTGNWSSGQEILAFDSALEELFGTSLHMRGDRALIGAREERRGIFLQMGAAYVLERPAPGLAWQSRAKLIASDASPGDQLGTSVHIGENFYAAGAGAPFLGDGQGYTFGFDDDYRSFCFGDLAGSSGCTPCPCANAAPEGTYGGCLHSFGSSAKLLPSGVPSVSNDTARFELRDAPPGSFALLQSGNSPLPMPGGPCAPGSGIQSLTLDGLRCVGGGVVRMGVRPTDNQGNAGLTNAGWGGSDAPVGGILAKGAFVAGQSSYFQIFFRDMPNFPCDRGLDTTNAIEMIVRP